ncbi:nuclear transport factor 2 family protein [Paenibacillus ihumii]|uniref:nuclear transport factor 2 family protein n=1 Tax=Paenibacillus ihumii TaxID=687436 RepID=UPI0006D7FEE1|nr:nuclear transport factor 2 family protein [Paenibacillus ihumii]
MNRDKAIEIVTLYFESWMEKDFIKFTKVMHDEAIVRECTGAVIEGKDELTRWFTEWNEGENTVLKWISHNFGFDKERMSAFVEWKFKCIFEGKEYEWDGSSIVYFRDSFIVELNEYEMKQEKFFPYRQ